MTSIEDAREAIYARFMGAWDGTALTSVTRDNERFTPPANASWVRLAVRHNGRQQETLGGTGNRKFLSTGSAFVQCFVPLDSGTRAASVLATKARAIFEGVHMVTQEIRFNEGVVREVGPTDGYFLVLMEALFEYTETK